MAATPVPEGCVEFDYEKVKELLEKSIEFVEKKGKVEIDADFFAKANIRITKKDRDTPEKRWIVSEQDTAQENFTDESTTYTFKSSFEERNSICLATSQGYSIGVGGNLGVGYMGANVGVNPSVQYSKSKSFGQDQTRAEIKELTAEVSVPPHTVVIVKELVYEVERSAKCNLELTLQETDKIYYKQTESSIEVKKLLQKAKQNKAKAADPKSSQPSLPLSRPIREPSLQANTTIANQVQSTHAHKIIVNTPDPLQFQPKMPLAFHPQVTLNKNTIVVEFSGDCLFSSKEHKLEIIKLASNPERVKRVISHQTGALEQQDKTKPPLSLKKQ